MSLKNTRLVFQQRSCASKNCISGDERVRRASGRSISDTYGLAETVSKQLVSREASGGISAIHTGWQERGQGEQVSCGAIRRGNQPRVLTLLAQVCGIHAMIFSSSRSEIALGTGYPSGDYGPGHKLTVLSWMIE